MAKKEENEVKRVSLFDKEVLLMSVFLTTGLYGGYRFYNRFLKRITKPSEIQSKYFRKRTLTGRVVTVGDGDNFHFYHTPGGIFTGWNWLRSAPKANSKGANKGTLHIRLCGVDAPERSHFGKPAQPYADEALDWLRSYILGSKVKVKLLSPDQYGRIVGKVLKPTLFGKKNVSLEMIKNGCGVVYEGKSHAEFDGDEELFKYHEIRAKKNKVGLWKKGLKQTPGQYKKQYR